MACAAYKNKEEQFPVWDATTFFTDMHHILRITSLGPVRTLSFYRLKLLEQVHMQYHLLGEKKNEKKKKKKKRTPKLRFCRDLRLIETWTKKIPFLFFSFLA